MRTIFFATIAVLCLAIPAQATVWGFSNSLDGAQETPPNTSPGTGSVTATLNDLTRQIIISGGYQNLLGIRGDSHLHCCAPPGTPALILFGLTNNPPSATSGTFTGSAVLTAQNVADILNGLSYINVHTSEVPGGEIRGQLMNPVSTFPGDFNVDRQVDAADYVAWRKGKDLIYGDEDYVVWRAHFGQPTGGSSLTNSAVPEAATCFTFATGILGMLAFRRTMR